MREIRYCQRCVVSNQRPIACREYRRTPDREPERMAFDAEGVCGACRVAEAKAHTDWGARAAQLEALLDRHRRRDGRPDVLVPGSGGKDSVYAAHMLTTQYGMHPLTVTWAPHEYTEVGRRNFSRWLGLGLDNILVTPNPRVHRLLTRVAFTTLLHPFQPFVLGQRSVAPKLAARWDIPLVFYGEDDREYEGVSGWQATPETAPAAATHLGGVPWLDLVQTHGLTRHDLQLYLPPDEASLEGVQTHALGHYLRWDPQSAYYYAVEHAGFEANAARTEGTYSTYNSIDDRLDPLHYFTMYVKWGIGRATHDASQEIRNGYLTREEGVALVRQYDGELRPSTVTWACQYMGITEETFWGVITRAQQARPWLWDWSDEPPYFRLRQQVT